MAEKLIFKIKSSFFVWISTSESALSALTIDPINPKGKLLPRSSFHFSLLAEN
jgi:hypothetical protein